MDASAEGSGWRAATAENEVNGNVFAASARWEHKRNP